MLLPFMYAYPTFPNMMNEAFPEIYHVNMRADHYFITGKNKPSLKGYQGIVSGTNWDVLYHGTRISYTIH